MAESRSWDPVPVEWPPGEMPKWSLLFEFTEREGRAEWTGLRIERHGLHAVMEDDPPVLSAGLIRAIPFARESARARQLVERGLWREAGGEPEAATRRGRGAPRLGRPFYREVAKVYRRAVFFRQPPGLAVKAWAEKKRGKPVTRTAVANWIAEARRLGLLAPYQAAPAGAAARAPAGAAARAAGEAAVAAPKEGPRADSSESSGSE